jgi:DNA-binding MarR family transcriptional regulator
MHPATLGQSIDELRTMDLVTVRRDPRDKRARVVALTDKGRELMTRAPLAGPIRLREIESEPARLDALKAAFEDALALFGLEEHAPKSAARGQSQPLADDAMES